MSCFDGGQPIRVLVVENDRRVRAALRSFLSASNGLEVVADTGDAATALTMARDRDPDVALVDVLLPAAPQGLELLRALTGQLGIPAIALGFYGWLRGGALAAGAFRFLDKDSAPDLVVEALRAAVPHPSRASPISPVSDRCAGPLCWTRDR